jgi:hypothetical protein
MLLSIGVLIRRRSAVDAVWVRCTHELTTLNNHSSRVVTTTAPALLQSRQTIRTEYLHSTPELTVYRG